MGVLPSGGVGQAVKDGGYGGGFHGMPPEKISSLHFEKCMHVMQLKLTEYVRITIALFYKPKPGEVIMIRTSLAKFSIFAYISVKIGYIELGDDYDVTVTSYLGYWYLFWYVWKEEIPGCTIVPIRCIWENHSQVLRGITTNHPSPW